MNMEEKEDIWSLETYAGIVEEIQDFLQLYLFKDSSIDHELAVNQLFNLGNKDIHTLKVLHFLISEEVGNFVHVLPVLIRNLSHSTNKEEIETHGNIIGQIDWNQTFKQRMDTGLKDKSLFVCNTNKKLYDLPENQLLKYILHKINKFLKDMDINFREYSESYIEEINNYYEYLYNIYIITSKISKNIHLKNVYLPHFITTKTVNKTIKSHNNLYEELVKVYDLYEKLFISNDDTVLLELLNKQILIPNNYDTLYEVYLLFNIVKKMDSSSTRFGLLKSGNNYIINSQYDDKQVNIYYQHLPEIFTKNNLTKLRPYYDIQLTNKRPDIIIEYVKGNNKTYKIIEVKRTQDSKYIRDSIYKVFGYLKDYEEIKLIRPNILAVWDGISIKTKENYDKQEVIILNKKEFLKNINNLVLYEKEKIDTNNYWEKLRQYHEIEYSPIGNNYDDDWYAIDLDDIPYKIANIQLKLNKNSIEIQLYHIFFRDIYDYLFEHADEIEKEIGEILTWRGRNSKRLSSFIYLTKEIDYTDKDNWQECIEWHSQMINKFKEVFIKYLKSCDLNRWRKDAVIKTESSHRKYWNILINNIKQDHFSIPEVSSGGSQIIRSNINTAQYILRTDYSKKNISIDLFIFYGNDLFDYLEKDKKSIEEELGYELVWDNKSKWSCKISLSTDKYNPKHEELWNYCIKWHLDNLDKFIDTFENRIKEYENNIMGDKR